MYYFLLIGCVVLSAALCKAVLALAPRLGLIDIPNKRSSHTTPTARAGGIAFVISFLVGLGLLHHLGWVDHQLWLTFVLGGTLIALTGFIDDFSHLPAMLRLFIQAGVVIAILLSLKKLPPLSLGFALWHWHTLGYVIMFLGFVWLINLYNFMDGIDGLASSQAVFVCAATALLLYVQGDHSGLIPILLLLAGSVLGFVIFNWPPAVLFMGDIGSGFIGFALGTLLVHSVIHHVLTPWHWMMLLGVFWIDATMTLISRKLKGEHLFEAHRTHVFQILTNNLGNHRIVLLGIMLINLLWLLPLTLVTHAYPTQVLPIMCLALLPLFGLWFYFRRQLIDEEEEKEEHAYGSV